MTHTSFEKSKMLDITRDKPIKVAVRVSVPVRDHPKVIHIVVFFILNLEKKSCFKKSPYLTKEPFVLHPKDESLVGILIKTQLFTHLMFSRHIQFNFVGKLLGPKGNSLKRLQEETMCKMAVLGRGSMRDRKKVN